MYKVTEKTVHKVMEINKVLIENDYTWSEIKTFWNECIISARNREVAELSKKNTLNDISEQLKIHPSVVQKITTDYWDRKMKLKNQKTIIK